MKLIRYHHPPFVKHVLAPQNEFGTQKKYLVNLQKFWELGRPPPCWEKFPNNDVFFSDSVPKVKKGKLDKRSKCSEGQWQKVHEKCLFSHLTIQ